MPIVPLLLYVRGFRHGQALRSAAVKAGSVRRTSALMAPVSQAQQGGRTGGTAWNGGSVCPRNRAPGKAILVLGAAELGCTPKPISAVSGAASRRVLSEADR